MEQVIATDYEACLHCDCNILPGDEMLRNKDNETICLKCGQE